MTTAAPEIQPAAVAPSIATPTRAVTPAIECVDVWKQYYFYQHRPRKLRELLAQTLTFGRAKKPEPVWAIRDFNLRVYPGETVGVTGHNGAGKSTLLKLLSRIHAPTKGTVKINGRLSSIIELGAGFHEDLSGRENVYLAASFLGFKRRDVDKLYDRIVDFAELAEHMETPVKYYSSGMQARLGFSIAIMVDPDVLLIDEVLAVGDARFQPKCKDAIRRFQRAGKAILLVTHDLEVIKSICDRCIWMKHGQIMRDASPQEAITDYLEHYWPGCTKPGWKRPEWEEAHSNR
jgi:ABC-type polysaccharide/polyol phosphate transport system ATPase subunit